MIAVNSEVLHLVCMLSTVRPSFKHVCILTCAQDLLQISEGYNAKSNWNSLARPMWAFYEASPLYWLYSRTTQGSRHRWGLSSDRCFFTDTTTTLNNSMNCPLFPCQCTVSQACSGSSCFRYRHTSFISHLEGFLFCRKFVGTGCCASLVPRSSCWAL